MAAQLLFLLLVLALPSEFSTEIIPTEFFFFALVGIILIGIWEYRS